MSFFLFLNNFLLLLCGSLWVIIDFRPSFSRSSHYFGWRWWFNIISLFSFLIISIVANFYLYLYCPCYACIHFLLLSIFPIFPLFVTIFIIITHTLNLHFLWYVKTIIICHIFYCFVKLPLISPLFCYFIISLNFIFLVVFLVIFFIVIEFIIHVFINVSFWLLFLRYCCFILFSYIFTPCFLPSSSSFSYKSFLPYCISSFPPYKIVSPFLLLLFLSLILLF